MKAMDRLYLVVAALFVVLVAGAVYRAGIRDDVLRQVARERALAIDSVNQHIADSLGRVERPARETLTVRVTRWRDQAMRVDTAFLRDTVPVPVEVVREVVQSADSAVTACERVVGISEQRSIALDSVVSALRTQIANAPKPKSGWRSKAEMVGTAVAFFWLGSKLR